MNFAAMGPRAIPIIKVGNASPRYHFCLIFTEIMPYRMVKPPNAAIAVLFVCQKGKGHLPKTAMIILSSLILSVGIAS